MTDSAAAAPPQGTGSTGGIRRLVESDGFESIIATLLVLNAFALGFEALADTSEWEDVLWAFFLGSQIVFLVEIVLRIVSYAPRVFDFFKDGWNVFDFVLVAISLVPEIGTLSVAARSVRVLRVLRALRVLRLFSLFGRRSSRGEGS